MPQKPPKKDNLPVKVDVDLQNGGTISYANEVIATIAGVAANEIDGIAGMCVSGGFGEILGRNKNITRGVKVEVGSQEAAVDLYIIVEYGSPIQKVAAEVQENVRKALESLTGLHVVRVDVHVQGVSFEKEKKAAENSLEAAKNPALAEPVRKPLMQPAQQPAQEPEKQPEPVPAVEEAPQEVQVEIVDDAAADAEQAEAADADAETLAEEAQVDGADAEQAPPVQEIPAEEAPAQEIPQEESAEKPKGKEAPARKRPAGRKRC